MTENFIFLWAILLFLLSFLQFSGSISTNDPYLLVATMSTSGSASINPNNKVGSYYTADLALSTSTIVIQGGSSTRSFAKNLTSAGIPLTGLNGAVLIAELRNQSIYTLLDSSAALLSSPGRVAAIRKISNNGFTWTTSGSAITLSSSIRMGIGSAIFSGLDRIVIADADSLAVFEIKLPSGTVTELGGCTLRWQPSDGWYSIGVAEFFSADVTALVYGSVNGYIERQYVADDPDFNQAASSALKFDQLAALTVDIKKNRWYFYYAGSGPFNTATANSSSTTLGYATASFTEIFPTSQPSGQPTSSPTFLIAAPKLISIVATPSRTGVSLALTIDSRSSYSGTIYCAAFTDTTAVSYSGNQIMLAGSSVNYVAKQTSASLSLSGLIPITNYALFCYVTTYNSLASTTTDITNTKRLFTTQCCKLVTLTNAPVSLFSDPTKYLNQPALTFTFYYSLSNLPTNQIIVTPLLRSTSGNLISTSVVATVPTSLTFSSTSVSSSGYFILSPAQTSFTGTYRVVVNVTGTSGAEYSSTSSTVSFLSAASIPAPPKLSLARLGDSGGDMFITFDSATNLGGFSYSASWRCGQIFRFSGSNVTDCFWLNNTAVRGVFQKVANTSVLVNIGNTVSLLSSKIKADCPSTVSSDTCKKYNFSSTQSLTMLAPLTPVSPTVIVKMPASVGSCDNVTVDTTQTSGSGGRAWAKAVWTVSALSGNGDVASILRVLNRFNRDVIRVYVIPRALFGSGTYSISLSLTNFLQVTSTASNVINALSNPNIPKVNILGGAAVTTSANKALTVYSSVSFSSCVDTSNTKMQYTWQLRQGSALTNIAQTSRDPSIYQLNAYSLTAGVVYTLSLNASAIVGGRLGGYASAVQTITVASGIVKAVISGGNSRQVPMNQNITLDGSTSYDENTLINTGLAFRWSCKISSFKNFGQSCDNVIIQRLITAQRTGIIGAALTFNVTYSIALTVLASDGRTSSATVIVTPLAIGSASTSIVTQAVKFNINQNFTLEASILSQFGVTVAWQALVNGQTTSFTSFSPTTATLDAVYVRNSVIFPLIIGANSFTAGTSVTFQLTATTASTSSSVLRGSPATSSAVLTANGPPVNGEISIVPKTGFSLTTSFLLQSLNWVDDPDDYPLYTSFSYSRGSGPSLTVQSKSQLTSVTSTFPAGLESFNYVITVSLTIADSYNAEATVSDVIVVKVDTNINVTNYLTSNLQAAFASSNAQTALLTVNNAASTINTVNCSRVNATYCGSLNRANCAGTANTCGSCLAGFSGRIGDANTLCFNLTATSSNGRRLSSGGGEEGSACNGPNDCLYGNCTAGTCRTPLLTCPSISDDICSGNGFCAYTNPSGLLYSSPCLISDVFCSAQCVCFDGYGGSDCSLDPKKVKDRDQNRAILCASIIKVANLSNPSAKLIDSLVTSLYESYSPDEVTTEATQSLCYDALDVLTYLISEKYLIGTAPSTTTYLIGLTSKFVAGTNTSVTNSRQNIGDTITNITDGVLSTLQNGQAPLSISTDNVRITVRKDLLSTLTDSILSPPPSATESAFGYAVSSFYIEGNASAYACQSGNGYSHSSIIAFGKNPYYNSSQVQSPLLRFSGNFKRPKVSTSVLQKTKYYITLQFITQQNFNRTLINSILNNPSIDRSLLSNVTFPKCSLYNGQEYVSCGNCDVYTYTDYNVTFKCTDISQLCQSTSSSTSSSSAMAWENYVNGLYEDTAYDETGILRRSLASDDDLFSDDSTQVGNVLSVQQYGALIQAIGISFVNTLSANPFNVDVNQAKPVIAFLGAVFSIFILGLVGFSTWDSFDRNQLIYANYWPPRQNEVMKKLKYKLIKKKKVDYDAVMYNMRLSGRGYSESSSTNMMGGSIGGREIEDIIVKDEEKYLMQMNKAMKRSPSLRASMKAAGVIPNATTSLRSTFNKETSINSVNSTLTNNSTANTTVSKKKRGTPKRGKSKRNKSKRITKEGEEKDNQDLTEDERLQQPPVIIEEEQGEDEEEDDDSNNNNSNINTNDYASLKKREKQRDKERQKEKERQKKLLHQRRKNLVFSANMSDFFDLVLPEIFEGSTLLMLFRAIAIRHDYLTVFFRASAENNRFIRWVDLFNGVLSSVFISTLFFGVFYSNSGTCETYVSQATCEVDLNAVTGLYQCQWKPDDPTITNSGGDCVLRQPPSNISFTIILALTCTMICLPLQLFVSFVLDEFCRKRPILEQIGMTTSYWFGHGIGALAIDFQDTRISQLQRNFEDAEKYYHSNPNAVVGRQGIHMLRHIKSVSGNTTTTNNNMSMMTTESPTASSGSGGSGGVTSVLSDRYAEIMALEKTLTVEEELEKICLSVQKHYFRNSYVTSSLTKNQLDAWTDAYNARTKAIIKYFGISPDGTFRPLPLYDYLLYYNPRQKLESKLHKSRRKSEELTTELEELSPISTQLKEVVMLHSFILEQFTPFKRWILKQQLLCFQGFIPDKIDAIPWLLSWLFIYALYAFYFYWILSWGVQNGDLLYKSWGLNFAIDCIQDIFFVQVVKVTLLYAIAILAIRPQLIEIRYHLHAIGLSFLQGFIPLRKYMTSSYHQDYFSVIQHLSPSCRVAWESKYDNLVMSKILRQIDDYDMLSLRKNYDYRMAVISVIVVILPVMIYFFGALAGEVTIEVLLPVMSSGFIVANYYLFTISINVLIIPYIIVGGCLWWYLFLYRKSKQYYKRQKIRQERRQRIKQQQEEATASNKNDDFIRKKPHLLKEFGRACVKGLSSFYLNLALLLNPSLLFDQRRDQRKSEENTWCFMNFPNRLQPVIITTPSSHTTSSTTAKRRASEDWQEFGLGLSEEMIAHDDAFLDQLTSSAPAPSHHTTGNNTEREESKEVQGNPILGVMGRGGSMGEESSMTSSLERDDDSSGNLLHDDEVDFMLSAAHRSLTQRIAMIPDAIKALRTGNPTRIVKFREIQKHAPPRQTDEEEVVPENDDVSRFIDEHISQRHYQAMMTSVSNKKQRQQYLTNLLNKQLFNASRSVKGVTSDGHYEYNYDDAWKKQRQRDSLLPPRRQDIVTTSLAAPVTTSEVVSASPRQPFIPSKFFADDRRVTSEAVIYQQRHDVLYDIPNAILHMVLLYLHLLLPHRTDKELLATSLMLRGNKFPILLRDIDHLLVAIWEVYYPFDERLDSEEVQEIVGEFHAFLSDHLNSNEHTQTHQTTESLSQNPNPTTATQPPEHTATSSLPEVNTASPTTIIPSVIVTDPATTPLDLTADSLPNDGTTSSPPTDIIPSPEVLDATTPSDQPNQPEDSATSSPPTTTTTSIIPSPIIIDAIPAPITTTTTTSNDVTTISPDTVVDFPLFQAWFEHLLLTMTKFYHERKKEVLVHQEEQKRQYHRYSSYYYHRYRYLRHREMMLEEQEHIRGRVGAVPVGRRGSFTPSSMFNTIFGPHHSLCPQSLPPPPPPPSTETDLTPGRALMKEIRRIRQRQQEAKQAMQSSEDDAAAERRQIFDELITTPRRYTSLNKPKETREYDVDTTALRRSYDGYVAPTSLQYLNERYAQMSMDYESTHSAEDLLGSVVQYAILQRINGKREEEKVEEGEGDVAVKEGGVRQWLLPERASSLQLSPEKKEDDVSQVFKERGSFFFSAPPRQSSATNNTSMTSTEETKPAQPRLPPPILVSPRHPGGTPRTAGKKSVRYQDELEL